MLSGGASLGAVEAGMLLALAERGIEPDLLVGTSAGAVNAAYVAHHRGVDGARELVALWSGIRTSDVFPPSPVDLVLALLGIGDHLVDSGALRRLAEQHLGYTRLEQAGTPVHLVAAEVTTGRAVVLSRGGAVDAVLASSAIPAVFPPVRIGRRLLMDGGVASNTPVDQAVALGAQRVYVLPTGFACAPSQPPKGVLSMAVHAMAVLLEQRLINAVDTWKHEVDLRVITPPCPVRVLPTDFGHGAELAARGHRSAVAWLDTHPRRFRGSTDALRGLDRR